jgi:hypothetical protein
MTNVALSRSMVAERSKSREISWSDPYNAPSNIRRSRWLRETRLLPSRATPESASIANGVLEGSIRPLILEPTPS